MSTQSLKPDWKMVKFGDIAQNVAVRVNPADAKTDVYVGLEHLDPSTLHLRQWGHPSDVIGQKLAFKKGDVIFGRRRAYQRKLAVAELDGICSAHAMVVRAKSKMILPEFLPFFLQSDMFMERAIEISVGSLSPTINWKTLRAQEFPLPPLDEQKRLAEILWAADDTAEAYESVLLSLERSVDVYSDKNFLLHEARKKKPNIPPGWRIGFLNEIAKIDPSMPKGLPDELDVSFVPMESVNEGGGISKSEIKKLGEVRKGYTYFEENDVLFAKITPCMENGKGAIAVSLKNNIAMGSTEYYVFRAIKSEDTQFIYHLTMSGVFRKRAERWMQGSAGHRRVPKDFFTRRPIVIPDSESRRKIGLALDSLQSQKTKIRRHIDAIRTGAAVFLQQSLSQTGAANV
jgi:restriction endonuclease S subunit